MDTCKPKIKIISGRGVYFIGNFTCSVKSKTKPSVFPQDWCKTSWYLYKWLWEKERKNMCACISLSCPYSNIWNEILSLSAFPYLYLSLNFHSPRPITLFVTHSPAYSPSQAYLKKFYSKNLFKRFFVRPPGLPSHLFWND